MDTTLFVRSLWPYTRVENPAVLNGTLGNYLLTASSKMCLSNRKRCAQLFVYSTGGNSQPTDTVSIPGYVDPYHKGVLFNYWLNKTPSNYQIPGPEPRFSIVSSPGKSPIKVPFKPHNYGECVVKNANWCAVSPPRFTDTPGCWAVWLI